MTAVMMGAQCLVARVEIDADGRLALAAAAEGSAQALARWRAEGLFADSQALLVLRGEERHCMTLERPDVLDAELGLAVRWPLGEALDAEPEALLTTALALPRINDALRPQVLAVAARLDLVEGHLTTLAEAGIRVRAVDVVDSALRGMVLTRPVDNDGWVVFAPVGDGVCIGLLWRGEFCALRMLALPARGLNDDAALREQLALQVLRSTDLFERQAMHLAVRHVLAALPALADDARDALLGALPLSAEFFDLSKAFAGNGAAHRTCAGHGELTALACVAAARLVDARKPREAASSASAAGATA